MKKFIAKNWLWLSLVILVLGVGSYFLFFRNSVRAILKKILTAEELRTVEDWAISIKTGDDYETKWLEDVKKGAADLGISIDENLLLSAVYQAHLAGSVSKEKWDMAYNEAKRLNNSLI